MLGISLSEFIVILCIAVVLIRPEDMPTIIKMVKSFLKKISLLKKEYSKTMTKLQKELDLEDDFEDDNQIILDANGRPQIAYDIEELKGNFKAKSSTKKRRYRIH